MKRWRIEIALGVGLAACQGAPSAPELVDIEITALEWIADTADPVAHLTTHPSTCVTAPEDPAVGRGALLFASPMLLGGQAAKAGLSCAACHRNGRGNEAFAFSGISGAPGTADVTHGLFSKIRADGVFNPVAIPDLARPEGHVIVDRDAPGALEAFLSAQVVEEFSGTALDQAVISDLATYIRALDERVCDPDATEVHTWQSEIKLVRAGLSADPQRIAAYEDAMRAALGRIHERFPGDFDIRADLVSLSRMIKADIDRATIEAALDEVSNALASAAADSLYDPERLAAALR